MEDKDIRWKQRFNNFTKALAQLERFVKKGKELNELEKQGLIKAFEYTYELAWNTMKDFYENQGEETIQGSRDAIALSFRRGLVYDGEGWMKMLKDRNQTSHTYNEETADKISTAILNTYFSLFKELHQTMQNIINGQSGLFTGNK